MVEFVDEAAFNDWHSRQHDQRVEVVVKLHKLSSGRRSITPKHAIDVALCWGWIDAVRKGLDATSHLQRIDRPPEGTGAESHGVKAPLEGRLASS